jgi:hypothetical protein
LSNARTSSAVKSSAIGHLLVAACADTLTDKGSMITREGIIAAARGWLGTSHHTSGERKGCGLRLPGLDPRPLYRPRTRNGDVTLVDDTKVAQLAGTKAPKAK